MRQWHRSLVCTAVLALSCGTAQAQDPAAAYPLKPVLLVVPIAAGGPIDQEARLYAKMTGLFGQPIIVDNKPGAGTTIGTAFVARAAPDGYTLLTNSAGHTTAPALYKELPFDVLKDFAPITLMSEKPYALITHPGFGAKTAADYLAYARGNPGKLNYGTSGGGGITHIVGAWLHGTTSTKVTFVHYKGAGPSLVDLMAGRLDVTSVALVGVWPQIKSGKLRVLGVTGAKRPPLLPDLPTIGEQGVTGFHYTPWQGVLAPAATPATIQAKLNGIFSRIAKAPEVAGPLETAGNVMVGSSAAHFREVIAAEVPRWRKVVAENGIELVE